MTQQLPQAIEAEQAVLGGLMLSDLSALIQVQHLKPEDFYRRDHQLIYQAIRHLSENDKPFDSITVAEWFESQGMGEQVAGGSYLIELSSTTPGAANIKAYAEIVKEMAAKRRLIELGTEIVNRGFNCAASNEIITDSIAELTRAATEVNQANRTPLDLFGEHAFPALNPDWLPPGVAAYAADQAEIIGVRQEMIAMSCLSAIGAAMSDNIRIKVKQNENWTERARLWMMLIAEPGSKKSLAIKKPMGYLSSVEREFKDRFAKESAKYDLDMRVYAQKQREHVKREAKGEGLDEPPEIPGRPVNRRITVNNVTIEKLGELFVDNPQGLHFYSDELAIWFGQHDAYRKNGGGQDRAYALAAFDGGSNTFDRIGRGTVTVPNWSYSLVGTTQPEKIKAMVQGMSDDGLLQRFITVEIPNEAIYENEDRPANPELEQQWERAISTMYAWGANGSGAVVQMSEGADRVRREFMRWVVRVAATEGLPPMLRSHIAKWRAIYPRLLLCYHAYGCAASGKYITSLPVAEKTSLRVMSFMKKYLLPQAMRFYANTVSAADSTYNLAKKIAGMILAQELGRLTNRDMQHHIQDWREATEMDKTGALNLLKESAWLTGTDSRRATGAESGWAVHPMVHVLFKDRARAERIRCETASATLAELRG